MKDMKMMIHMKMIMKTSKNILKNMEMEMILMIKKKKDMNKIKQKKINMMIDYFELLSL
jgi:hypothetical protein